MLSGKNLRVEFHLRSFEDNPPLMVAAVTVRKYRTQRVALFWKETVLATQENKTVIFTRNGIGLWECDDPFFNNQCDVKFHQCSAEFQNQLRMLWKYRHWRVS